jgi:uncharacterized membrane protein YkgB
VPDQRISVVEQTSRLVDQAGLLASRLGIPLLRVTLGLVYVWFGALKVVSRSDVFGLVAGTLPFLNPYVFVPTLGVIEILLGLGLVFGRMPRLVFILVLAHLAGTFLTIFTVPNMLWHSHDPLLLSTDGEFVLKNLVLISAVLVLLGVASRIRLGSAEGPVARRT